MGMGWPDDEWHDTLYDGEGNAVKRLKEQAPIESDSSGFTIYDTSHGHCGLCGRLGCRGNCFK
jgi:hypothetical protein